MIRILHEEDIRAILTGAAFLSAGGGGSLGDGLDMLSGSASRCGGVALRLADADDISDGGSAAVIGAMGCPDALLGRAEKLYSESCGAVTAMLNAAYLSGKRIEGILPLCYGAVSYMAAIIACLDRDLPLMDAEGCGRAVPGIDATLYNVTGIPFSPGVAADGNGNIMRIYPYQAKDGKAAANMCHHICTAFGNVMGLGGWITEPQDIKDKLIPGGVSLAEQVGRAILTAGVGPDAVAGALESLVAPRLLAAGKVVEHGGGRTALTCGDGKSYTIDFKGSNLVFRAADRVLLTAPNLICMLDGTTGAPLTNAELEPGMEVACYAVAAPMAWFATEAGVSAWAPYLAAAGYNGGVVSHG